MPATVASEELQRAVSHAVNLVNTHSGNASIMLRFKDSDGADIDFVANSARLDGEKFLFTAGYEEYAGLIEELSAIEARLIN